MGINSMKNDIRKPKLIQNPKDVQFILSIDPVTAAKKSTIMDLFADFGDGPKFNTYDIIRIPKGSYGKSKKNKNEFTTTVGIYIFNKGMLEDLSDAVGYVNKSIDDDTYSDINKKLSYALLENRITIDQLKRFIMQGQIYMSCCSALAPSHTMKLLLMTTDVEKKKEELEKKYSKEIEDMDIKGITDMQNELLDYAKSYIKDDPSADMFNSGARSSYGNNFKNMYVMNGLINKSDGSYHYVRSSYISGASKEDYPAICDSMIAGPYARAVNTKEGGYKEKKFLYGLQHVKILPNGSDCGTTRTTPVTLDKKNIDGWMYSYIRESNGTLTQITSLNRDKLIGKTVNLRFSGLCESKHGICEKCAGALFGKLGIYNAGLACDAIASKQKNVSMKQFHDSTLNFNVMDVEKAFGY